MIDCFVRFRDMMFARKDTGVKINDPGIVFPYVGQDIPGHIRQHCGFNIRGLNCEVVV